MMQVEQGWTGVVLAGGRSSRMGRDKAMIPWEGRTLLGHALALLDPHVDELLVIGDPITYAQEHDHVVPDAIPGAGPLGGVITAMRHATHDRLLVLACDMPRVPDRLWKRLRSGLAHPISAFVPVCDGRVQPLAAAYHRRCLPVFEALVDRSELKMVHALEQVRATFTQLCPGEDEWPNDMFRNINTPSDL
jgi:molybdenum cofactor guanylyltransferase